MAADYGYDWVSSLDLGIFDFGHGSEVTFLESTFREKISDALI